MKRPHLVVTALALLLVIGAYRVWELSQWRTLEVMATAYNSLSGQTTAVDPDLAAWGDRLHPDMRVIAVSRDLIDAGLGYGTVVKIEGFDGEWQVLDKMNKRWTRKIDIYMGTDVNAAREWGHRPVTISWRVQEAE